MRRRKRATSCRVDATLAWLRAWQTKAILSAARATNGIIAIYPLIVWEVGWVKNTPTFLGMSECLRGWGSAAKDEPMAAAADEIGRFSDQLIPERSWGWREGRRGD